jgi:hypothetical protein
MYIYLFIYIVYIYLRCAASLLVTSRQPEQVVAGVAGMAGEVRVAAAGEDTRQADAWGTCGTHNTGDNYIDAVQDGNC